jgi:hypothetical protein
MARTPPPDVERAEWGKRLTYVACVAILLFTVILVIFGQADPRRYLVGWDAITLGEQPPMPAADFLREVRAIGRFGETLDLSDQPGVFEQLYQAFARHEWVERVQHVGLTAPRQVRVDLAFRTPVARVRRGGQWHLVDRHGKLLLPLHPDQGKDLVQLTGWEDRPTLDAPAAAWLAEAAALAAQLRKDLDTWNIASIELVRLRTLGLVELCLRTRGGTCVFWKTLEGATKEEPGFDEKVSRLRTYQERYGTLDLPPGQMLDVRDQEGIQRKPLMR